MAQGGFEAIKDKFTSLEDVTEALREAGVDKCSLIIGIDYTLSNRLLGKNTFGGYCLHELNGHSANPYQQVISTLGRTLEPFDEDGVIPAFGFGDNIVKGNSIFPLKKEGECNGFQEVLDVYNKITPDIKLGGPTNFAPLIEEAMRIVEKTQQYHILVICADGQVTREDDTVSAIVRASGLPLSILMVGLGDGPWIVMNDFDDKIKERQFDNFSFIDFHGEMSKAKNPNPSFAACALSQIPSAYKMIKKLQLIEKLCNK